LVNSTTAKLSRQSRLVARREVLGVVTGIWTDQI
jgi:hypothetical protein